LIGIAISMTGVLTIILGDDFAARRARRRHEQM
jgi:hypothetical protein